MIDRYIIKMAPAMRHKEIVKQFFALAGLTSEQINQLSRMKSED